MSKEYIEREMVLELLSEVPLWKECTPFLLSEMHLSLTSAFKKFQNNINSLSAADVEPVRHGEWLPHTEYGSFGPYQNGWRCSLCNRTEAYKQPYCNCGALMDGGK